MWRRQAAAAAAACRLLAACTLLPALHQPAADPNAPPQGDSAGVGSVVKCGEEDDPIGVSTVLPLSVHRGAAPLQQLRAFLAAAAGEHRQRLEQVRRGVRVVREACSWRLGAARNAAADCLHAKGSARRASSCTFAGLYSAPQQVLPTPPRPPTICPSPRQAWDAPDTGLVVNERLVNCPPELAEPLQDSLFGEVAEAAEDGELPQVRCGGWHWLALRWQG